MTTENTERIEFCQAILGKVQVVLDSSPGVNDKVNRAIRKGGQCDGYYEVLTKYDPKTDLFNGCIPASRIERVAFFDAMGKVIGQFVELFGNQEPKLTE